MEQIYKNLYKDEEGRYLFANDEDTRYVIDQQSYIMIYILELLQKILERQNMETLLSNENVEGQNGKT